MMIENRQYKSLTGVGVICFLVVAAFAAMLLIPESREVFRVLSAEHLMAMGFIKFALLATVGELVAARLTKKAWLLPSALVPRIVIWGALGTVLALMLKLYSGGVAFLLENGFLPGAGIAFVSAFATSLAMNVTFGPVMMGFHRLTDQYLDLRSERKAGVDLQTVISNVDWQGYVRFVLLRTIPFFWVPAHTVTFLLPPEFQTIMAAFLSIALGIILSLKKS